MEHQESNLKASRELARQAFLYGEGDGVPVLDIHKLMSLSGLSAVTIKRHLGAWTEEREEMLLSKGNCKLAMHLSGKTIKDHHKDVEFLREHANEVRRQAETLPDMISKLESLVMDMVEGLDFGPDDAEKAISLLDKYLKTKATEASTMNLFLAIQKRWQESSGIAATMKAWEAGQREAEKGLARVQSKKEELELLKDGSLEVVTTPQLGVFARTKRPDAGSGV